jgi:hypothetical protein
LPEEPEPLLLERRVETGDDSYVDRITADGGVWVGGTVHAALSGGEWQFSRSEPGWRREATLTADALAALRDAIDRSGFFATAPEHHPDAPVIHASNEVWTADLDGRRHSSTLHARGVTKVPELSALAAALESALASTDRG